MTVDSVATSIPDELRNHPQWIGWTKTERNGKETKLPLSPEGDVAKTSDEDTWSDFDEAVEYAEKNDEGVGFVFSEDDSYVGFDLDNCRDPETGEVEEWAENIVEDISSYTEISPSETGLHILAKSDEPIPDSWTNIKNESKGIEVYDSGRFFTVTGNIVEEAPNSCNFVTDLPELLREIREENTEEAEKDSRSQQTDIGVYDVIPESQYPKEEKVAHPFHDSETGTNFEVDKGGETWRCWRHESTGNALHLVGIREGVFDCGEWDRREITNEEWSRIFDSIEDNITTDEFVDSVQEHPNRWIDGENKVITVQTVSHQQNLKNCLQERDIPQSDITEILVGLDSDYAEAFRDFWEDGEDWSIEVSNTGDSWSDIRELYDVSKKKGRERAVEKIREEFDLVTLERTEELLYYDENTGTYRRSGERVVREKLERELQSYFQRREVQEIVYRLKSQNVRQRGEFDSYETKICVGNGVLDLETGELEPHSPDYYFLSRVQADYDENADCPKFKEFLDDVCPNKYRSMLQEYVGYCLQPDTDRKKALIILGTTDAGKSVFLDTVQALFGDESTANQSIQYLVNERWGIAELQGKKVNVRHDLGSSAIRNVGKVKELIAGNPMKGERKNKDPFKMEPRTKHLFSANQAPERSTEDDGFWNRWLTVVFPESIPKDEQDAKLTEKLTQEEELSGVLNWAIEGYQRLMEQERFTNEPRSWENRNRWESYGNSVEQFLDACVERSQDSYETKEDVYSVYKEFAREEGMEVVTKSKLTQELKKKSGITDGQRTVDEDRERVYEGISLREDEDE